MFWAWNQNLNPTQKLVLLALADSSNDDGQCYPGYGEIKRKTGIKSDATISSAIKALIEGGFLSKRNRYKAVGDKPKRTSNLYQLPITSNAEDIGSVTSGNEVSNTSNIEVSNTSGNEDKPNNEPNNESKRIPAEINPDSWQEWFDYKKSNRKKITPQAQTKQFKFLGQFDYPTQQSIIDQSIQNDWTGLFPLRESRATQSATTLEDKTKALIAALEEDDAAA